MRTNGLEKGA